MPDGRSGPKTHTTDDDIRAPMMPGDEDGVAHVRTIPRVADDNMEMINTPTPRGASAW